MGQSWVMELPVLGVRVRYQGDSLAVRRVVQAAFGPWKGLDRRLVTGHRVTVRFQVHDGSEDTRGHAPVQYWMPNPEQLIARTPGSEALADVARREAAARVTRELVGDAAHFRYTFVEALTLFILSSLDRAPFHCAALVRNGRTVLLSGPPGVGKSTLTYAAMRQGFRVFAEDMVWVQRRPRPRLWGMVGAVHLPEDSGRFFPELRRRKVTLLANGQRKIAVRLGSRSRAPQAVTDQAIVCLLARVSGRARLQRIRRPELVAALRGSTASGFDRYPEASQVTAAAFAGRGGWMLKLGPNPFDALALLDDLLVAPEA